MTLLIVDDEDCAIEGIRRGVDWSRLPFDLILDAGSCDDARAVFEREPVDVLLCDIEMPGGSGLDLLEWVREHRRDAESIILTCHDRFDYARRAVKLECLDYVLKPVPYRALEAVLLRACKRRDEARRSRLLEDYGKYYIDNIVAPEPQAGFGDAVGEAEQYLRAHLGEHLTVEELARRAFMSPDHLARSFKKRFGRTMTDYLTELRLLTARELIEAGQGSLTEISVSVGYDDYSYFGRLFKKRFGLTPSQLRDAPPQAREE